MVVIFIWQLTVLTIYVFLYGKAYLVCVFSNIDIAFSLVHVASAKAFVCDLEQTGTTHIIRTITEFCILVP